MKNMSVSKKVFAGFAILMLLMIIIAVTSVVGATYIERAYDAENASAMLRRLEWVVGVVFALSVVSSIIVAKYLISTVAKPLVPLARWMDEVALHGDLTVTPEDAVLIKQVSARTDEIGTLFLCYDHLIHYMNEICDEAKLIAEGDLSVKIKTYSDKDVLNITLQNMVNSLSRAFSEISKSAEQVAIASSHVADASTNLANGSTEQAASAEELAASVAHIMELVRVSDKDTDLSMEKSSESVDLMGRSQTSMLGMLEATKAIESSAQDIGKVIKVIDDIAFQTNILALNAAVEAARAGQHGRGFAVVADEVRNLAAKSSEAARETAALIEGDAAHVERGAAAVAQTNENLELVSVSISENADLVKEIADIVRDLAVDMQTISDRVEKISHVTQSNAATSEEAAATADELATSAGILNDIVASFKLADNPSAESGFAHSSATGFSLS